MERIEKYIALGVTLLSIMTGVCTNQTAGVETTNGATVVMRENTIEGTTPPFASVYLFDTSYIPYVDTGFGIVVTADEEGYFQMNNIAVNVLNVQIVDSRKKWGVLLPVGADGETYRSDLKSPGKFQGIVETSDSGRILVFISGTGNYVLQKEQGTFNFDNLPPGLYSVRAALLTSSENGGKPILHALSQTIHVTVNSDETTIMKEKIIIP